MKVLVTGATGYVGTRLILLLIEQGHQVIALVRNPQRFKQSKNDKIEVIKGDLLDEKSIQNLPENIDAAYYLVHSMSNDPALFTFRDRTAALNFMVAIQKTRCKQLIYLSGLVSDIKLSKHFQSRLEVEQILKQGPVPVTVLRASIIIGSGSASFEMIRDLVEKLPIMITPSWVQKKCQPIAISDVLDYLILVLNHKDCFAKTFEVGGPKALSYKAMLLGYAKIRKLRRILIPLPILSPRLSSYWLIFLTSTNYYLARSLIDSLKNDSIQTDFSIEKIFSKKCLTYEESLNRAIQKVRQNEVISSWRDAWVASDLPPDYMSYIEVPKLGCFSQTTLMKFKGDPNKVMKIVLNLGGKEGYYLNWAWKIRGVIDRAFGGVGLRRGKTSRSKLETGDALDFWRVLISEEQKRRLLLYAEMRLPGEAWLEFKIESDKDGDWILIQTATFRPRGIFGRIYWYFLYPSHSIIFTGMGKKLIRLGGGSLK